MSKKKQVVTSKKQSNLESNAIYLAFTTGIVGLITGLILFSGAMIPVFAGKHGSLGLVATFLGAIISFVVYLFSVSSLQPKALFKFSNWTLALTHGLLAFVLYAVLFYIIGLSFQGATMDTLASAIVLTITSAFAGYFTYLSASNMNTMKISTLLATFLVIGIFISMLTAHDPNWWHYNFSALGAGEGVSGEAFNWTLIIAGMIAVSLASFLALDLKVLKGSGILSPKTRAMVIRVCLSGIGIFLAFVGIFVVSAYPVLHVLSATGMTVIFGAMIIILPWIVPNFSKAFYIASYILLLALVIAAWLFLVVGYFNLTALEMIAFAIIFTWLILFVRHISAMLEDK